jgi:c(7)-type cytochrome triheme protein
MTADRSSRARRVESFRVRALLAPALLAAALVAVARAAPPPGAPPTAGWKLPPDLVYDHVVGADSAVVFRHTTHVDLEGGRCTGCHPRLYRMLTPTHRARHLEMDAHLSCGACHDGRHAFDTRASESCASCHAGRRAAAAGASAASSTAPGAFKGPAPIVYRRGDGSPGVVTFRHATHAGANSPCTACHPKRFAMRSAGARPDGAMHDGAACGACHDGRRAFATDDDASCTKCHVERKAAP